MGSCFQCEYLTLGSDSKSSSLSLASSRNIFPGMYNFGKLIMIIFFMYLYRYGGPSSQKVDIKKLSTEINLH